LEEGKIRGKTVEKKAFFDGFYSGADELSPRLDNFTKKRQLVIY
jgi:hypothetical protein